MKLQIQDGQKEGGFTLVELLISLALLSLMSAFTFATLSSFKTINRISADLQDGAAVDAAVRYMRQTLADTRIIYQSSEDGLTRVVFTGEANRLRFVAVSNDDLETGGLYDLELSVDDEGNLVSKRQLHRPDGEESVPSVITVLGDTKAFELRYFGGATPEKESSWSNTWKEMDRLPLMVEVKLENGASSRSTITFDVSLAGAR